MGQNRVGSVGASHHVNRSAVLEKVAADSRCFHAAAAGLVLHFEEFLHVYYYCYFMSFKTIKKF